MDDDELTAEIQAQVDEWSSNSNECTTLQLVRGDGSIAASFKPEFTYPIFGNEEAIFGYRDLNIVISFAAHNLRPRLRVQYRDIFKAQVEVRPTDIAEALSDYLPAGALAQDASEESAAEAVGFVPPGERIHEYSRDGLAYEIWCASLADARAKQLLENMQIFVPMFIEGGTMLQLEKDWTAQRWKLFLLYDVDRKISQGSPYTLVGYGTSYRVFTLPDRQKPSPADLDLFTSTTASLEHLIASTAHQPTIISSPSELPSRERLSQFVILPDFQGCGHGRHLYNTMYTHLTTPPNVREFTVEDPNEAFDDLRDLCDLLYLRRHSPAFAALRINTNVPAPQLASTAPIPTDLIVSGAIRESIMRQTKIMPRQFDRMVEMHTLSFIPPLHRSRNRLTKREHSANEHDKAYYFWRMYVKQRLYVFNRDQLAQVERQERIEKLEGALDSVQEGYAKMLEKVEARESEAAVEGDGGQMVVEGAAAPKVRKRKVVGDDEEDDEEEEKANGEGSTAVNGYKKARISVA